MTVFNLAQLLVRNASSFGNCLQKPFYQQEADIILPKYNNKQLKSGQSKQSN